MTRQHVELLRELYDRRTLEEFAVSLHPAAEVRQERAIPERDAYYGREDFIRGLRLWLEEWDRIRFIPEDMLDLGERVLIRWRISRRASASAVALDETVYHLWTFRDEMRWRCEAFFDEQQARASPGTDSSRHCSSPSCPWNVPPPAS